MHLAIREPFAIVLCPLSMPMFKFQRDSKQVSVVHLLASTEYWLDVHLYPYRYTSWSTISKLDIKLYPHELSPCIQYISTIDMFKYPLNLYICVFMYVYIYLYIYSHTLTNLWFSRYLLHYDISVTTSTLKHPRWYPPLVPPGTQWEFRWDAPRTFSRVPVPGFCWGRIFRSVDHIWMYRSYIYI